MDRIKEIEQYIQGFREERTQHKRGQIYAYCDEWRTSLCHPLDKLMEDQIKKQKTGAQQRIKTLCFFRLLTSGYTGSHEAALAMSSHKLYLDKNLHSVYWSPNLLYDRLEADMAELEKHVRKSFTRVEEYELVRLRQKLLLDDWNILCEALKEVTDEIIGRVMETPLLLEQEFHVLCGDYMGQLSTICHVRTEGGQA